MGPKKPVSRLQPVMTKMKDISNCVRAKLSSCNAKFLRNKNDKADEKVEHEQQTCIGGTQQSYELKQLDTKNYDHYFKNNTRFYNYQRTRRISENSDPEQHYQISKEQCKQDNDGQYPNKMAKIQTNRPRPTLRPQRIRQRLAINHETFIKPNDELQSNELDCNNNENSKEICTCKSQNVNEIECEPDIFSEDERTIFESEEDETIADYHPKPAQPAYVQKPYQLMHPDWRWIPHVPLYGWTPHHEQNIRRLYDEMAEGRITSMYYKDPVEYEECERLYRSLKKHDHFLKKPTVSTLEEVFELIKKTIQHDDRFKQPKRTKCPSFGKEDNGYDADIEETVI
ncbi:unnamed protein product [Bemisia tabaci]|uniref:Uncharacterized protein n=1 Tax=Bemisia tabaci TaxID=7038 RepID=A0A9P0F1D3_BEMTA|nr:unnamed protein product [Bemisia tabaci]